MGLVLLCCRMDSSPCCSACVLTLPVCMLLSLVVYEYCHFGFGFCMVGGLYAIIVAVCVCESLMI